MKTELELLPDNFACRIKRPEPSVGGDHIYLGDVAVRTQRRVPGQRRAKPLERRHLAFAYAFDGE